MANSWFRLYSEFATDPKVQMLSEANQRRLIMLFCFRCNVTSPLHVTLQDEEVTFLLRISNSEWLETKAIFVTKGFINSSNELLNWDKRQFISDTSAGRVSKYRSRKNKEKSTGCDDATTGKDECNVTCNGDVTLQVTKCNALDTDTDTDTDINPISRKNALDDDFLLFWKNYPKKVGRSAAFKFWQKLKPPIDEVLNAVAWQVKSVAWMKEGGAYIPNPATYLNGERWKDEPFLVKVPQVRSQVTEGMAVL